MQDDIQMKLITHRWLFTTYLHDGLRFKCKKRTGESAREWAAQSRRA